MVTEAQRQAVIGSGNLVEVTSGNDLVVWLLDAEGRIGCDCEQEKAGFDELKRLDISAHSPNCVLRIDFAAREFRHF